MKHLVSIARVALSVSVAFVCQTKAADVSTDLSDIDTAFYKDVGDSRISPIGDLNEPLETVIDLRGFIPLTLMSKEKKGNLRDNDKYFRLPVELGLAVIYYGVKIEADETTFAEKIKVIEKLMIVKEADAKQEYGEWIKLAYGMTKEGSKLFSTLGGSRGYNSAEPILLLFTRSSCLIVVSFEYEDFNVKQGQVLAAFEFSRSFNEYKKYYDIRNTFLFSKGLRDSFEASGPIMVDFLKLYIGN